MQSDSNHWLHYDEDDDDMQGVADRINSLTLTKQKSDIQHEKNTKKKTV